MRNSALLRELSIVLALKTMLLAVLWVMFFSHPAAPNLDAAQVGQALLASHPALPTREARDDH